MERKQLKYILIVMGVLLTLTIIFAFLFSFRTEKKEEEKKEVANEIKKETENQVGGEIVKEGYNITYEEGRDRTIITITDIPFLEKVEFAKKELKEKGFDFCAKNYLVLTTGGVERPLNWSEEELCDR